MTTGGWAQDGTPAPEPTDAPAPADAPASAEPENTPGPANPAVTPLQDDPEKTAIPSTAATPERTDDAARIAALETQAYRNIFPLFGRALAKRGIELPLPWGINLAYIYNSQLIDLDELALSFNDAERQPVEFIEFGENRLNVHALNLRLDLWILPMISIYAMGILSPAGEIDVKVVEPIVLDAGTDLNAAGTGFGVTGAWRFGQTMVSGDVNFGWVWAPQIEGPSKTIIGSVRAGQNYDLPKSWSLTWWSGVMYQRFGRDTVGSLPLKDVLPPFDYDGARAGCADLGAVQEAGCTALIDELEEKQPLSNTTVNYAIQKGPRNPWAMVAGVQVGYGRHWAFRTELSFLTKFQVMGMATYRFGIPFRKAPTEKEPAAPTESPTELPTEG